MNYQTCEQLTIMRLAAMKREYQRQDELPAMGELSFDERFAMIVQAQTDQRKNNQLRKALKKATLREPSATLANIDYSVERNLSRAMIAQLSDMSWVKKSEGVIITGATGTGKTYLMCALGYNGCMLGLKVKYYRMTRLIEEMNAARAAGTYEKKIIEMASPDLLILDDFAMKQCDHLFSMDLLEIMDERLCSKKSVMIGSQIPVRLWNESFKNRTAGDGFMDRVVNRAYRIELKGPSRRERLTSEQMWGDEENNAHDEVTLQNDVQETERT